MNATLLRTWLRTHHASSALADLATALLRILPIGITFESPKWNVVDWATRPGNNRVLNLNFNTITSADLGIASRIWVLHDRLAQQIGVSAAQERICAVSTLSQVIDNRSIASLKTEDFIRAERLLSARLGAGTAFRRAGYLHVLSHWLNVSFGLRVDYRNQLVNPAVHGRYGTNEGRAAKLIPLEVLRDLVAANTRTDLIPKDKFYLSALTVDIGSGFRINELATLPADCLLREGSALQILYVPEKGGAMVPRPIHPEMASVVDVATKKLISATASARELACQQMQEPQLDWSRIIRDPSAFKYFTNRWVQDWTSRPENQLINPKGGWHGPQHRFIDVVSAWHKAGGNKSKAARSLGLNREMFHKLLVEQQSSIRGNLPPGRRAGNPKRGDWDVDSRVVSFAKLERHCSISLTQKSRKIIRSIIESAKDSQVKGKRYPKQRLNATLERQYLKTVGPVIRDKRGNAILDVGKALFVVQKYQFSKQRGTKVAEYRLLSDSDFSRWLSGVTRSLGTGNHEDSVFRRLNIIDPRTGEIAKFTWHDIRAWLDTTYENGGLTQQQIALIFGRKNIAQNASYDQTARKTRIDRLKQGIRDKVIVGRVADTFSRLASYSRDEAEEYLGAAVRMVNPMPHGACTLDWSRSPCPHHLSCFKRESDGQGPCEHLVLDPTDKNQIEELKRIEREARLTVSALNGQGGSPQMAHFRAVSTNVGSILGKMQNSEESGNPRG